MRRSRKITRKIPNGFMKKMKPPRRNIQTGLIRYLWWTIRNVRIVEIQAKNTRARSLDGEVTTIRPADKITKVATRVFAILTNFESLFAYK
jgi:hypothetical protein